MERRPRQAQAGLRLGILAGSPRGAAEAQCIEGRRIINQITRRNRRNWSLRQDIEIFAFGI